jgi:hypothetical protein
MSGAGGFFAPKGSAPPKAGAFNPRQASSQVSSKEKTSIVSFSFKLFRLPKVV